MGFDLWKDESNDTCCTKVGGRFRHVGSHNGRAKYMNELGAAIYFHHAWRLDLSEDSVVAAYAAPGQTGLRPPRGQWASPLNPGKVAEISYDSGLTCRVCAQGYSSK